MDKEILLLDEEMQPCMNEKECAELKPIIKDFVEIYAQNQEEPVEKWLSQKMQESLPEKTSEEIQEMTNEIISTLEETEEKKKSLNQAIANGRSKESWFASQMQKAVSAMSAQEAVTYLSDLDNALKTANESLYQTIKTKAGSISQNPCLDGFIAEQYHVQTFNLNAQATGSQYRAKVLQPTGSGYAKNSVDIVIIDGSGKVVKRYQSKYCKNAKATQQAFEHGDYRGQQKLIPEGQQEEFAKKASTIIEAPDGTTSNPLSKVSAERMRDEAQSGKWSELNWNEYKMKDLAIGIGKQAGCAALQGAAIGVGIDVVQKLWNGESIKGEEVVETALVSGADFGTKAAVAGAMKVGVEKGIINIIPKGTPAGTFANIAFVAVENAKITWKMMSGELTFKEGVEKIESTTVATVAGLVTMGKGALIGAKIGTIFGPVGTAIGSFVGGTVGYMAGSQIGETVVRGAQKLRDGVVEVAKKIGSGMKDVVSEVVSGIKKFLWA